MVAASCALPHALLVAACRGLPSALQPLRSVLALPCGMGTTAASCGLPCTLRHGLAALCGLPCALRSRADVSAALPHALRALTATGASLSLPHAAYDPAAEEVAAPECRLDGRAVELLSLELSTDEDAFLIQSTLELARVEDWLTAASGASCEIDVAGQTVALLVDQRTRSREFGHEQLHVEASSPASRLAAPYAAPLTRTWQNATAKSIAQELCAMAAETPLSLDWRICDWTLELFSVEAQTPMEALIRLVTGAARVLSTTGGEVVVQYLYPHSPTRHGRHEPEAFLSDFEDITLLDQESGLRPCYDAVDVLSEAPGADLSLQVREWQAQEDEEEQRLPRSQRLVAVFVWPWQEVLLETSGCDSRLHPQGEHDFVREELVEFVDGSGELDYPAEELLDWTWRCEDLGSISAQGTALQAGPHAGAGCSLALVRYRSRCRRFILESSATGQVQVYAQSAGAAAASAGLLLTVRRGAGQRPSPDSIVDPLCRSLAILRERGRNYLDEQGSMKELYEAVTPPRSLPLPGALAQVSDGSLREKWRAKVTGWNLSMQGEGQATLRWLLERSLVS